MHRKLPLSRIKSSLSSDWSLDTAEVKVRRTEFGSNDITETKSNRWIEIAKETAMDPMIWFLVGTSVLFAILKNYNQTLILLLAALPLIGMDAFLHWRTQTSTQSLRESLASYTIVIRNNIKIHITAQELVPGDLVMIPSGTFFPADGIIVSSKDLQVDESSLTGESFPVRKESLTYLREDIPEPMIAASHWGFAGTRLLTGEAQLRVVYTGQETLYGNIITSVLFTTQSRTPLQKAIAKLVLNLIFLAIILCTILAGVRLIQGFGFVDAILSAATLAVAALPDEFPVVFTLFLGLGVYRLATKKALVRRAVSVENIGRVTCICTDKTGTITEGQFKLAQYFPAPGYETSRLLYLAALASHPESGDPIDLSITEESKKLNLTFPKRIKIFPFTEDRRRETAVIEMEETNLLIASKGSPEEILNICTLTVVEKEHWLRKISELAASGLKVIACAEYSPASSTISIEPQTNYTFSGLLAFVDPPRKEVFEAIQRCLASGIHILMITGDHIETARSIAKQIGLGRGEPKVILAHEAENEWKNKNGNFFQTVDVIARALPSQKLAIVTALQASNEIVAATGDGVNDVPALKAADIGIAMGNRGTQSAREVADIVLLDDNFTNIVDAISEGRQLFDNLKSSFKYLLMIHAPFVISAALIPLFGYPLLYAPIHIVWIELFIHPTSMLVFQNLPQKIELDPIQKQKYFSFFSKRDWAAIIFTSLFTTTFLVLAYIFILKTFNNVEHARAFALGTLGCMSGALTLGLTGFKTRIARIIIIGSFFFTFLFVQVPSIAQFLTMQPLPWEDWAIILGTSLITAWLARI